MLKSMAKRIAEPAVYGTFTDDLHLYDVHGVASKAQIKAFTKKRQNRLNQLYQFAVYQKFILIRKRIC